jgi:hypothetical protein
MTEKTSKRRSPQDEMWLGNTPYRELLGLKIAIVAALIGFAAGGLPIVLSSPPDGALIVITHWIFISAFFAMVAGGAWQVFVSFGLLKRWRNRKRV